jgi:hypothetical protein
MDEPYHDYFSLEIVISTENVQNPLDHAHEFARMAGCCFE